MAKTPRPIRSGALHIGHVAIPFGLYAAVRERVAPELVRLHADCGSAIEEKRDLICTKDRAVVDRGDMIRRYEYEPGKTVTFTTAELKTIEATHDTIHIVE